MARLYGEDSAKCRDSDEPRVMAYTKRFSAIDVGIGELPNRVNIDTN
jgi:hypothetical protein